MSDQPTEEILVSQLGTENKILDKDRYDYRILSKIRPSTENPDTLRGFQYFCLVNEITEAKQNNQIITFSQAMESVALKLNVSVGGGGRRDVLYGEQVKRGIGISLNKEIPKPTLYDKIMRQDMVKQYEKQEAENLELE